MKIEMSSTSPPSRASNPLVEPAKQLELDASFKDAILADTTLPEPVRKALLAGMPLERITLDGEGRWWHEGDPIDNPRIVELFNRSIERTAGGTYVLHIAPFTYPIEVKDTPYFVRRVELVDDGARLMLSDGSEEPLDVPSLRASVGRGFCCAVKGGAFSARFGRPAYYTLAEHVEEVDGRFTLILGNTRSVIREES
jgi:uncharacterized protein